MRLTGKILNSAGELQGDLSLTAVKDNINHKLSTQSKWEIIMSNIKEQAGHRPRLIISCGLAAAILIVLTLVPFSYNQTVGFNLALCCADSTRTELRETLEADLIASGYDQARVKYDSARDCYRLTVENLPSEAAAEYVSQALAMVVEDELDAEIKKVTEKKAATFYAQARDLIKRVEKKEAKPRPIILRLDSNESLYINEHDIHKIIFSKSMSDDEIAEQLRDIYVGDDPELQAINVKVTTIPEDNERIIVINRGEKDISQADIDEYLKLGISLDDIYLIKGDSIKSDQPDEEKSRVKIMVPPDDKTFRGPGMLMKVYLPDED
jgi:hypothetical protein